MRGGGISRFISVVIVTNNSAVSTMAVRSVVCTSLSSPAAQDSGVSRISYRGVLIEY